MEKLFGTRLGAALAVMGALAVTTVVGGCQKTLSSAEMTTAGSDAAPMAVAAETAAPQHAGALLWSQNCARCHNLRNPREWSDREWDVIVQHMRVRANLTAEEHRLILAFLKSAN